MRALAIVACLVAFAGVGGADEPSTAAERIRAQLASEDPKDVAWGLHDAIEGHVAGLDDSIRDVIARRIKVGGIAGRELLTWAIDAVIELGVTLPNEAWSAWAAEVDTPRRLLLAARSPEGAREFLRRLVAVSPDSETWMAACGILAAIRDRAFAAWALGTLRFRTDLFVVDAGSNSGMGGRGFSRTGLWSVRGSSPKGWPRPFRWALARKATSGSRTLVDGPWPVYARRVEIGTAGYSGGPYATAHDHASLAPDYLAAMLGLDRRKVRASLTTEPNVRFVDAEDWRRLYEEARRAPVLRWLALAYGCWRQGLLTAFELALLRPHVEFEVHDARASKEPPLPSIPSPAAPPADLADSGFGSTSRSAEVPRSAKSPA